MAEIATGVTLSEMTQKLAGRPNSIYGTLRKELASPSSQLALGGEVMVLANSGFTAQKLEIFVGPSTEYVYLEPDVLNKRMRELVDAISTGQQQPEVGTIGKIRYMPSGSYRDILHSVSVATIERTEPVGSVTREVTHVTERRMVKSRIDEPEVLEAIGALEEVESEDSTSPVETTYYRDIVVYAFPSLRMARVAAQCREAQLAGEMIGQDYYGLRELYERRLVSQSVARAVLEAPESRDSLESMLGQMLAPREEAQSGRRVFYDR